MDSIYTLLALAIVILIGAGGIYFMRKYKVKEHEKQIIEMTLQLIDLIVARLDDDFKFKNKLVLVSNYVVQAYYLIDDLDEKPAIQQKALIKSYTIKLCREHHVEVDSELLQAIDDAVVLLLEMQDIRLKS